MFKSLVNKFRSIFSRKKTRAIPFAEHSKKAVSPTDKKTTQKTIKKTVDKQVKTVNKPDAKKKRKKWSVSEFNVPVSEGKLRFHDLNLPVSIMHAISDLNFQYCTPVQAGILPEALKGKDAIGQAQTGTGKSAAFLITILTHMIRNSIGGPPPKGKPRALILAPTRELVVQIEKDAMQLTKYTPFKILSVFGGIGYEKQSKLLKERNFDIIVATPGRLIDFKNKKLINLSKVEILVLDEADRMLDMGFIPDVRKIVYSTPHKNNRQTFFYSATFSPEVNRLAEQWTKNPCRVEIQPENVAAETITQCVYLVTSEEKFPLLYNTIINNNLSKVLVFTNRRDQARDLALKLNNYNINTTLLSGEVHQKKRMSSLENFRSGKFRVLVATDVAARGIHIDDISHVINYNLPQDPENYVHRIGRTGRAGVSGISVSFACEDDSFHIPDIESVLGNPLKCEHPDDSLLIVPPKPEKKTEAQSNKTSNQRKPVQKRRYSNSRNSNKKRQNYGNYKSRRPQGYRKKTDMKSSE